MKAQALLSIASVAVGAVIPDAASHSEQVSGEAPTVRFRGVTPPYSPSVYGRRVDRVTSNVVEMQKTTGHVPHPAWYNSLRKNLADSWDLTTAPNGTVSSTNMTFLYHTSYVIPVKIGGQDFQLSVDTGSSDTWVIKNNFTCIDTFFGVVEPAYCNFGPTFNGTFKYGLVPNVANFSFQYADGSYVSGQTGYEDVTLAGVTIKKQQMLMTSEAAWAGDRITSGILGLSYPLETRIFNGTASDQNFLGSSTHRKYDPVFTNMYKQGLVDPVFSMAMDRAAQKGWLAFGGLPPVDHAPDFAKTKIRMVEVENLAATSVENTYYTIIPDGFTFGRLNTTNFNYSNPTWNGLFNDTNKSQFPVMIDSGATLSYLPRDIVLPYVRQFTGPVGRFGGQYWAPCNATIPAFGITIGGKTFYLNNSDLLQQEVQQEQLYNDTPITLCLIGMMDTFPNGPFVFGDTFLNSLVTVFDVGKSEMRFYKRK